jgi:thiosulfate dehydrogenase (quinone) large subunit
MKWYRTPQVSILWTVLRIWLGIQWIEAGWGKLTGAESFNAGGFVQGALAKATGEHPAVQSWYANFLESFALPNIGLFNFLIPWGETLVGLGLIVGLATIPALLAGAFMNLNFMLAGTVSTNPILYTVAMILLFVGSGAFYWGLDRLFVPAIRRRFGNNGSKQPTGAQ